MDERDLQQALDSLRHEQERVTLRVGRLTDAGWQAALQPMGLERLVQRGHFPSHPWELDWSPREVVGHLRDSAQVFARRIELIRSQQRPDLPDFRTDAPQRLADYRDTPAATLVEQLEEAQEALVQAAAAVTPGEVVRAGVHERQGEMTLGDIMRFLPEHQRDHAEQLAALTAETLA